MSSNTKSATFRKYVEDRTLEGEGAAMAADVMETNGRAPIQTKSSQTANPSLTKPLSTQKIQGGLSSEGPVRNFTLLLLTAAHNIKKRIENAHPFRAYPSLIPRSAKFGFKLTAPKKFQDLSEFKTLLEEVDKALK
eukprot:9148443-Ditylum_brightwellii.AAC.1